MCFRLMSLILLMQENIIVFLKGWLSEDILLLAAAVTFLPELAGQKRPIRRGFCFVLDSIESEVGFGQLAFTVYGALLTGSVCTSAQ